MLIFALLFVLPFAQQTDQVIITSQGEQTGVGDIRRATTNVVVTYKDVRVEADWAEYNEATQQLTAGDRVHFKRGEEALEGGRLAYNFETKTGTFAEVKGQVEPGFFVTSGEVELLANGNWVSRKITTTACEGECPDWNMSFSEALIVPGKSVTGKDAVFRFKNVPLLWFPRATLPTTNRERSTGFLIPSIGRSGTKGNSVRQAFYWAPNRSMDATFTGEYFSKRGPAGTIDFRAVPNARTSVDISTFFAVDRMDQGGHRTRILSQSDFGDGWRGLADIDITSGLEFRQVYEEGFNLISSPIERSLGFLTNNREHSSINFLYDRSAIFFVDQPSVALRKFPAVDLSLPTAAIARKIPVYFSVDFGFSGVARRAGQLATPSLVQRIDAQPTIDVPLVRSRAVQWSHRLSLRETLYTHSLKPDVVRDTLNRAAVDYSMRIAGPELERSFGTWRHIIQPSIDYRYVTGIDHFRETIVVDDVDLLTNTNEVEYALTNRLIGGHEFLSWRIAQKLYFDPEFGGALLPYRRNTLEPLMDLTGFAFSDGTPRRFSPLVSTIRIATSPQTSTDIQVDYDTQTREFRSAGVMGGLNRGAWYSSIAYFFNKSNAIQSSNNQLRGLVRYGSFDKPGFSGGISFYYDIHRSLLQGSSAQIGYNADCYGLSFDFTQIDVGARKEKGFRFALSLKNLGSFGTLRRQERLF
jgi:LPS-assembly protein